MCKIHINPINHMENTEYKINKTCNWLIGYSQNTSFLCVFYQDKKS